MALKVDISEVSAAMDALAEAVRAVRVRIPVEDMVEMSHQAAAGRTGRPAHASTDVVTPCDGCCAGLPGGLLLESFIVTNGKRSSRRMLLALAKRCAAEERECTEEEAAPLLAAEQVGFYFFLLSALSSRGRSANRQLFFMTLLAQAKGLSRTGMEVFSAMNVCIAPRTFNLELKTFLCVVAQRERSACININGVMISQAQICLFSAGPCRQACTCSG
jgi:hypothetical protein